MTLGKWAALQTSALLTTMPARLGLCYLLRVQQGMEMGPHVGVQPQRQGW